MPSYVDIINMALIRLGNQTITSIDDDSKAARSFKSIYEYQRDLLLSSHNWVFAKGRATLAQASPAPDFGYTYAYNLPSDCLKPRKVIAVTEPAWVRENDGTNNQLLTEASEVDLLYTRKVEDPVQFDPHFIKAYYLQMAAECAWLVPQKKNLRDSLIAEADMALAEAKRQDAIQGNEDETPPDSSWQSAGR